MGFFAFRLYIVQVVNATDGDSSISTYTYQTNVSAARGQILDRNGNILVSNRASYNVIINDYVLFNSESPNEDLLRLVRLCDKLGIGLAASSSGSGTTITLSFHINDFITGVQS